MFPHPAKRVLVNNRNSQTSQSVIICISRLLPSIATYMFFNEENKVIPKLGL